MISEFTNTYRALSNFWFIGVYLPDDKILYPSVEHAYQAAKTLDIEQRQIIVNADTPGKAKRLGKELTLRDNWNKQRRAIMLHLLKIKFAYPDMEMLLLSTGNQKLVEGNVWHDNYWGECSCMACKDDIKHNWLGKLLMLIRMEIQIRKGIE